MVLTASILTLAPDTLHRNSSPAPRLGQLLEGTPCHSFPRHSGVVLHGAEEGLKGKPPSVVSSEMPTLMVSHDQGNLWTQALAANQLWHWKASCVFFFSTYVQYICCAHRRLLQTAKRPRNIKAFNRQPHIKFPADSVQHDLNLTENMFTRMSPANLTSQPPKARTKARHCQPVAPLESASYGTSQPRSRAHRGPSGDLELLSPAEHPLTASIGNKPHLFTSQAPNAGSSPGL